ncbi:MAG: beta-mannosidase [Daejeonella sp.]|nr:beta-mannosidase [Daejeonella sp.]
MACNSKNDVKNDPSGFVKVNNMAFEVDGKPYYYLGTNFWYGINLGSKGVGGNRER